MKIRKVEKIINRTEGNPGIVNDQHIVEKVAVEVPVSQASSQGKPAAPQE